MYCWKCGRELSDESDFCPFCGAELEKEKLINDNRVNKRVIACAVAVICIIFVIASVVVLRNKKLIAFDTDNTLEKNNNSTVESKENEEIEASINGLREICYAHYEDEWAERYGVSVYKSYIKEYDKDGNLLMHLEYDDPELDEAFVEEKQRIRTEYEYDSKNNLIIETEYNSNDDVTLMIENVYDSQNNLIKEERFEGDGVDIREFEYNENGDVTNIYRSGSEQNRYLECEKEYNQGELTKETYYFEGGSIDYYIEYTYQNDLLIKESNFDASPLMEKNNEKATVYEYDEQGNMISKSTYHPMADPNMEDCDSEEYKYDDDGNVIECIKRNSWGISSWKDFEFDNKGNEIKEIMRSSEGNIAWTIEREYDSSGKLTKVKTFDGEDNLIYWDEHVWEAR